MIRSQPKKYSLHTTRSWEFVGLEEEPEGYRKQFRTGENILSKAKYGKGVIVGLLDSGNNSNTNLDLVFDRPMTVWHACDSTVITFVI